MSGAFTPEKVNRRMRRLPLSTTVIYGGVSGYGLEGLPPGMVFEAPEMSVGQPAVVVASGYFPGIGVDRVDGVEGVAGTEIQVGDHVWRIARMVRASEDGAEVLLMLTEPD